MNKRLSSRKHCCKFHTLGGSPLSGKNKSVDWAQAKLSSAGYRFTKQRESILKVFVRAKKPLTASEVFQLASKKTKLDRVSSYRVIQVFKELSLIHPVGDSGLVFCSHQKNEEETHFYLLCGKCHCVQELGGASALAREIQSSVRSSSSFKFGGQIQVLGVCEHCA